MVLRLSKTILYLTPTRQKKYSMKRNILFLLFLLGILNLTFLSGRAQEQTICKGLVTCDGIGIKNIVVTDGINFCQTNNKGKYLLKVDKTSNFIYLSSPAGYLVPVDKSVPQFYKKLNGNTSSQKNDFQLIKNNLDETQHAFIAWADPQIKSNKEIPFLKDAATDLSDLLKSYKEIPFHGLGCGDIVGDNPELYDSTKQILSNTGIPFYQALGNHDMKYYGRSNETAQSTFEKHFGPAYYSFNKGEIHYIVLNNVFYIGRDYFYIGYLPEQQLEWLEKDLSFVAEESTVVITFHIPSALGEKDIKTFDYANISKSTSNKKALYEILKFYNVQLISGHLHCNNNILISPNIFEHNMSSVCGAWWQGDIAEDGTPKGYGVFNVDGSQISWYYKSIGKKKDYQFRVYPKGSNLEQLDFITANVWNWDPEWKIFWYENGQKIGEMEAYSGLDPDAIQAFSNKDELDYKWIQAKKNNHMFRAKPISESAKITIVVIDRFGKVYQNNL